MNNFYSCLFLLFLCLNYHSALGREVVFDVECYASIKPELIENRNSNLTDIEFDNQLKPTVVLDGECEVGSFDVDWETKNEFTLILLPKGPKNK